MQDVITVFKFTLNYAKQLVADIDNADMAIQPYPGMNHPAWILGHYAVGADFVASLLGETMLTDDAWMKKYGPGSVPVDDRSAYPEKAQLMEMAEATHSRAIELISNTDEAAYQRPNETPFFPDQFPTVGALLTHLLSTHAALHLGQLSVWRRCVGKDSVLGV